MVIRAYGGAFALLAAAAIVGGCGVDAGLSPTLFGGVADPGHPSVGLLTSPLSDPGMVRVCSATLVGKRTLLTAAHCVAGAGPFSFTLGSSTYAVASVTPHPSFAGGGKSVGTAAEFANDIGLAVLQREPTGVAPTPVSSRAPTAGARVTVVGFGVTKSSAKDAGVKRMATTQIGFIWSEFFSFATASKSAAQLCGGDSGGPTFLMQDGVEVQVGVHSMGNCDKGTSIDRRIDTHLAWIRSQAAGDLVVDTLAAHAPGSTVPPGQPTPTDPSQTEPEQLDPEAPGQQGEPKRDQEEPLGSDFGAVCSDPSECASGFCVDDYSFGGKYCSEYCNGPGQCPGGAECDTLAEHCVWTNFY